MSDHAWILENLAAYLTGGLEPAERERLEQHIAECVPCAAALNDARAMDVALSGLFVEARPSAALEDRVIQTLRNRPRDAWRLPVPAWLAVAAAALVLIGFTGTMANQILVQGGFPLKEMGEMQATANDVKRALDTAEKWRSETERLRRESERAVVDPNVLNEAEKELKDAEARLKPLLEHAGRHEDVSRLAEQSRRRMLSELDSLGKQKNTPSKDHNLGFNPVDGQPLNPLDEKDWERSHIPAAPESTARPASPPPQSALSYRGAMGGQDSAPRPAASGKPNPAGEVKGMGGGSGPGQRSVPAGDFGLASNGFQPGKVLDQPNDREIAKRQLRDNLKSRKDLFMWEERAEWQGSKELNQDKEVPRFPPPPAFKDAKKLPAEKPPEQAGPRKIIIRTGEIEYEVQSFDAAVATITRLIKNIKGGFIATVNSDKLANGKVRGSVVVRVPPENLDELILDLRTNLGKSGELKNQRIGSQDITKQYTDLESELKAARAMEGRLLEIIKTGKGQIKDLLAAEKELGNWRTRIEKIEGELRYYANQVALSTLTITLYEKEITAPFAIIEREQVQMGIEVEDVDQAYQAAQKAVREAKGRITRAELKQPSQGQFSALLRFEVSPDAAGPLRDRLKQLGTVARFDVSRQEETQGGAGKPSDGKVKRSDTRFHVHFYNLMDVPPHETVFVSLACIDVETAMKSLLARVDKAAGRVLSSNLTNTRGAQTQGDLQFQVKTTLADAVLEEIKSAGEVMTLQVRETTNVETTRKKRGFQVKLWAVEAATARETDELQLACTDVAASYRQVQEAVQKAKGRVRIAQLNEQHRRNVTATLDFDVRRADEDSVRAALLKAGAVYTRKVSRAADADNVVDSKVHWQITFVDQANIQPRETYKYGVEVADVDQTAAMLTGLAGQHNGRTVEANISRERRGQVTGKLIYDVPMAEVRELLDALKSAGIVRVQQSVKHPEVPDSPLAVARLDVTLSNAKLIVPSDDGVGPSVRRGLSDSVAVLSWSLRILILGLCVLSPWALVIWAIYRLAVRLRRRSTPAVPTA